MLLVLKLYHKITAYATKNWTKIIDNFVMYQTKIDFYKGIMK